MYKHGFVADTPKATKTSTPNSLFKKTAQGKNDKSVKFTKKYAPLRTPHRALKHLSKS